MDNRVQDYISKIEENGTIPNHALSGYEKYKYDVLIEAGLYDKNALNQNEHFFEDDGYNYECEYDEKTDSNVYYRLVPCKVTDEEFEKIASVSSVPPFDKYSGGGMFGHIGRKIKTLAKAICCIGMVFSCLIGLYQIIDAEDVIGGFYTIFIGSLGSWLGSFITYGFGELIDKATEIAENTKK